MEGIREVKISFERLLKVWLSKLDVAEEDLVAEDMKWFSAIFDDFFKGTNLNEFIDRDGRYQISIEFEEMDLSKFLKSTVEYGNSREERWTRLQVQKPNQFEYYKELNDFYSENYKNHNIIDIYFRILKKLYSIASEKESIRTKKILISLVTSTVYKVSIFEKENFDSTSLLRDFYYDVLKQLLSKKEIQGSSPDEEFIRRILFTSVFNIYYSPLLSYNKAPIITRYLLNIWTYLNSIEENNFLDDFLNSLSEMTISNSSFSEINLFDIRSLLKNDEQSTEYYTYLDNIKSKGRQIITLSDLEKFLKEIADVSLINVPQYISKNIPEYFLNKEEEAAFHLYKFRAMQGLVLEYLSLVLYFKGNDSFENSINKLRKNEQWSNHQRFFPNTMYDVLIWLIIFSNLKREMNFRILETSYGYKHLDDVVVYLFKDIVFSRESFAHALNLNGLLLNSTFLKSMIDISHDLLSRAKGNSILSNEEKRKAETFLKKLSTWLQQQITTSEIRSPIEPKIFNSLISDIYNQYKDKSIVRFLSNNLFPYSQKAKNNENLKVLISASDLPYRKYLIPDWYSETYGLSSAFSGYLVDEEIMHFDYRFLDKHVPILDEVLERESVSGLAQQYGNDCLFVFRNAYPEFWLRRDPSMSQRDEIQNVTSFTYNTFDRNSELILIPKSSMSIRYLYDGRLRNLQFYEKSLMYELVDLGGDHVLSDDFLAFIEKQHQKSEKSKEDLNKLFWVRIVVNAKIVLNEKNSILRYKLNPYGE